MADRKTLPERKNKVFKVGTYDAKHRQQLQQRAKQVERLYRAAIDKISRAAQPSLSDGDPDAEFHFEDFPQLNKSVEKLIRQMGAGLQANVDQGDEDAWTLSNAKNDAMVDYLAAHYSKDLPKKVLEEWKHPHLEALDEFMKRRDAGMSLSNGGSEASKLRGVWNLDQFKQELELALEMGIGQGKSAAELSRDVRQYLKYPDKLFRRVRGKNGNLRLSKAAKAFHPGRGVYRSSYKNALRLTATENNIAYRTCDHKRWNALPFVLGQEIRTSNNHTSGGVRIVDICDELAGKYPVEFKFTGWHPFCRCYAVSILAKEKEVDEYCRRLSKGESVDGYEFTGKQTDMPQEWSAWIDKNKDRIVKAQAEGRQMPYFLKDNPELLPKTAQKKIPHIGEILRVKGNPNYKDVGFDIYTGGVKATHVGHNFDKHKGWYETTVQDVGFKEGHAVILENEPQNEFMKKHTEGLWDGQKFEVAGAETATPNNIRNALKHCASKHSAQIAILYFPNGNFSVEKFEEGYAKYRGLKGSAQYKDFNLIYCISKKSIVLTKEKPSL